MNYTVLGSFGTKTDMAKKKSSNAKSGYQVRRQIRVLYHLQPLCNLTNHRKWFYATPEEHFLREPLLTQLQNWVTTYEPMIRARARIQQQLNQQGLKAIDEAFEHANSLGP
jgi:hypothetical protein